MLVEINVLRDTQKGQRICEKRFSYSFLPAKSRVKMMTSWYTPWPRIFFIIVREMRGLLRPYGFLSSRASVGGSVASASEANVSMMRLTHNICTAFSGESWR